MALKKKSFAKGSAVLEICGTHYFTGKYETVG